MLYRLDTRLFRAATTENVIYTRYADDITVSGESVETVQRFERLAMQIVKSTRSPRLTLNDQKRGIYLRGQKQMVTGLIVTPVGAVSIGRQRKRLISVMLHKVKIGTSDVNRMSYLKGLLGFCLANEPDFVSRMRRKYGNDVLDQVLAFDPPSRLRR
jgi:hypothetical protein